MKYDVLGIAAGAGLVVAHAVSHRGPYVLFIYAGLMLAVAIELGPALSQTLRDFADRVLYRVRDPGGWAFSAADVLTWTAIALLALWAVSATRRRSAASA